MPETIVQKVEHSRGKRIPHAPGNWLVGNLGEFRRNPLDFLVGIAGQYGDIVRFRVMYYSGILLNHPDYIKHVLQDNNRNYNKKNFDYEMLKPVLGEGLLTSDGDFWLRQRRLMQPAFHRKRIAGFGALMVEATGQMLERWEHHARQDGDTPLDVAEEMMRLTLHIVGQALFSQDISQEADTVGESFTYVNQALVDRIRRPFAPPLSWPTPGNRRFHYQVARLNQVVDEIITGRQVALRHNGQEGEDLLAMLLMARDEDTGEGMSVSQLRDEVMTLLLAGHETTANALSWTWYLLSQHPHVRQRLEAELSQALGGRMPQVEDLPSLPFTRQVIQEALRLYPPAWIISRRTIQADEIGGYPIPANSLVDMSAYVTHRHPRYWPNPEVFDPDRFAPGRAEELPPFAYFPFGGGPRLCIGRDFALLEAQLILASVAQRFRLELLPGHPVEPEPLITLRPMYGLKMILRPCN